MSIDYICRRNTIEEMKGDYLTLYCMEHSNQHKQMRQQILNIMCKYQLLNSDFTYNYQTFIKQLQYNITNVGEYN